MFKFAKDLISGDVIICAVLTYRDDDSKYVVRMQDYHEFQSINAVNKSLQVLTFLGFVQNSRARHHAITRAAQTIELGVVQLSDSLMFDLV